MKSTYKIFAMIVAAMGMASCSQELDMASEPNSTDVQLVYKTFRAGLAEDNDASTTRTAIGDEDIANNITSLCFSPQDRIKVFDEEGNEYILVSDNNTNSANCNFSGDVARAETYYAIYPAHEYNIVANQEAIIYIPTEQTAVEGSFDPKAHIMIAKSVNNTFQFNTINAFVKVTAPKDLEEIRVLSGSCKYEYIKEEEGEGKWTWTYNCVTPTAGKYYFSTDNGNIQPIQGSEEPIVLKGTIKAGKSYYISIAPGTYSPGLRFLYIATDGTAASYSTALEITLEPNHISKVKTLSERDFITLSN